MAERHRHQVNQVNRELLGGYLGYFDPFLGEAAKAEKLPRLVDVYISAHMLNHLVDYEQTGRKNELKVTVSTGIQHPIGFAATLGYNLQPSRVKFYWDLSRHRIPKPPIHEIFKQQRTK